MSDREVESANTRSDRHADQNQPLRPQRNKRRKRNYDSIRADLSILEKEKIKRKKKKNMAKTSGSSNKKIKVFQSKSAKISKLSAVAHAAAVAQARQVVVPSSSTPNATLLVPSEVSRENLSPLMLASPNLSAIHKKSTSNLSEGNKNDSKNKEDGKKEESRKPSKKQDSESEDSEKESTGEDDSQKGPKKDPKKDNSLSEEFNNEDNMNGFDDENKTVTLESNKSNDSDEEDDDTSGNSDSEELSSDSSESSSDEPSRQKKPKKLSKDEYLKQLRYPIQNDDTVELHPETEIFVLEDALYALKARKKLTHTSLARGLIELVFTEEAAMKCSLLGGVQKGPLGKTEESRPGLYPKAIKAIKDMATKFCLKNGIKREEPVNLHKQMSTKLSEIRRRVKIDLEWEAAKAEKKRKKKEKKEKKEKKTREREEKNKLKLD